VLADGAAPGAASSFITAYVAFDRAATKRFTPKLPRAAAGIVRAVDYSRSGVVAIFGQFGCQDHRVVVASVVQRGLTLAVKLVERPPAPGTAECMAIFPTYRVLALPRSGLSRPYPTQATVALARS